MNSIRVSMIADEAPLSTAEGISRIERYAETESLKGSRVLCFPEAYLTGYGTDEEHLDRALSVRNGETDRLREVAARYDVDLLAGFLEKTEDGRLFVTQGLFRPDGTAEYYRKTHLGEREKRVFSAGAYLPVFTLGCGLRAGIALCVENHFPEIAQTLSLRGAEVIFVPHAVPGGVSERAGIWKKYVPARSYDNRIYMLCCNLVTGNSGGGLYGTGPDGCEILPFSAEKGARSADLDPREVGKYHEPSAGMRYRYYPAQRRSSLYE